MKQSKDLELPKTCVVCDAPIMQHMVKGVIPNNTPKILVFINCDRCGKSFLTNMVSALVDDWYQELPARQPITLDEVIDFANFLRQDGAITFDTDIDDGPFFRKGRYAKIMQRQIDEEALKCQQ